MLYNPMQLTSLERELQVRMQSDALEVITFTRFVGASQIVVTSS